MTVIRSEAPGKIVLGGEYAVLHGAHGIAAAVDRYARVAIESVDEPALYLRTPGYRPGTRRYELSASGQLVRSPGTSDAQEFVLFEKAWSLCRSPQLHGSIITIDTTEFIDAGTGVKLGLGSSAAACAALVAALQSKADKQQVFSLAVGIHRDAQGGGSGIDIACAVHGGLVDYHEEVAETGLGMPHGLHAAVVWSGQSASTRDKLQQLSASLRNDRSRATLAGLCKEADLLAASWRNADAEALVARYRSYIVSLQAFDRHHGLGIFSGGHQQLLSMAEQSGLIYKPCGAGGGDVGIALTLEPRNLEAFTAAAFESGFTLLDVKLGADGLRNVRDKHDG